MCLVFLSGLISLGMDEALTLAKGPESLRTSFSKQGTAEVEAMIAGSMPTSSRAINPEGPSRSIQMLRESFWDP